MSQTMVETYLKNLYKIYQFRVAAQQAAQSNMSQLTIPSPQGTGTSISARELSLAAMRSVSPHYGSISSAANSPLQDTSNPLMNLGREILDSGPVKGTLDILSRPMYAIGGIADRLDAHQTKTPNLHEALSHISDTPGGFWKGLTGQEHHTFSEVMNRNPDFAAQPGPLKFAQGLVADIATDPTTYIPVAGAINLLKEPLMAAKAAKTGATAAKVVEDVKKPLAITAGPRFTASATGDITDKLAEKAPEVAAAPVAVSTASALQDALVKVPTAAHPQIDQITQPFKEVKTEIPVTATSPSPSLAMRRAVKMALLQTDEYKVGGKYTVSSLLRVAKENPEKAAQVDKLLNREVNDIYRTRNYAALYKGKKALTAVNFLNAHGATVAGLNLKQLHSLLSEGVIGTGEEAATHLPIHSPEDLKSFFLKNAKGETVSLHQYLSDLGVGIKTSEKQIIPAATKVITDTAYKSPQHADALAWMIAHEGKLPTRELAYLSKATPAQYLERIQQLKAKTVVSSYKGLGELEAAVKGGLIPEKAQQELYGIVGAKTWDEFKTKATDALKVTGERKAPAAEIAGKLTRISADNQDAIKAANAEWETPAQLIEKAAVGDTSALLKAKPGVTPQIVEDLSKALPHAIVENLIDPQDLAKYPYLTKFKAAKRTDKVMYQGRARNLHGWHGISQTDVFRSLAKSAATRHAQSGLKGKEFIQYARMRADLMYNDILPAMRVAEAALKDQGVKFIAGNQESGIMLSLVDTLDALGPATTKKYLFGIGRNRPQVFPTAILDAAEHMARAELTGGSKEIAKLAAIKILGNSERMTPNAATALAGEIEKALPRIMQRVSANYAEESIKIGQSVKSMSDETIANVISKFTDPNVPMGEALGEISQRVNFAGAIGRTIKAPPGATPVAKAIIDSELARKGIDAQGLVEADTAKAFEGAKDSKEAAKIGVKQQASRATSGLGDSGVDVQDLSDIMDVRLQAGIYRAGVPLTNKVVATVDALGRAFAAGYKNADLHYMVHVNRNVTQSFARIHRSIMQTTWEIARKAYGAEASTKLQEAFKYLQSGEKIEDPAMLQIMSSMKNSLDILFAGSGAGHGAYAARNGLFASHLNDVLAHYGVSDAYRFTDKVPLVQQAQVWKSWVDVTDPLDLLDKVHAAFQRATVDVTIGRDFSDVAHDWVSNVAKPGYVKLLDKRGTSTLFKYIDSSKFYDKTIVDQLPYLENVLNGTFLKNDRAGLLHLYDSVLHAWKAGVTIYRPGHHVRNLIGDMGLSFLAGVTNPGAYKSAARIMAGRASAYKEWDAFKALQAGSKSPVELGKTKIGISIGGKRIGFDDDTLWRAAFNQGILPDYSVLEDIAFNHTQTGSKIGGISITKPLGGRLQKAAGGLSQARDHWVRMAHFVDVLQKGKFKSFEEAIQAAGKEVRKWHPDGSDLTSFERQVMRRVIPFYSWFRKAIPLVVESLVMHPGRALVVPKAMSNFAQSMGIDPESLANPFPQDQLFPGWLEDNVLGPQWRGNLGIPGMGQYAGRYYGSNPGDPISDVGSSFLGASPQNSILGGLTPVAKIPLELATGQILGTGSSITSGADYIDSQIPGVSQIANITNTSVAGGGAPQYDVQKGRSAPGMDQVALLNFLTGLGIKDYSKPNYIKAAQFELRDKLRGR